MASEARSSTEADLQARRHEAAAYGRTVWAELMPGQTAPADDRALLRRLFARVEDDHVTTFEQYLNGWKTNLAELDAFVRARGVITLPDPLTLAIDRSPGFFVGQSVGGVYSPGPWAPEARTLLLLPTPPDDSRP